MSNTASVRVERATPLSAHERETLEGLVAELNRVLAPDDEFQLKFDRGPKGRLLFSGWMYCSLDPSSAKMRRLLATLTELKRTFADATFDAGDDSGSLRWSEARGAFVLDATDTSPPPSSPSRLEIVKQLGVQRVDGFLYYVAGDPCVVRRSSEKNRAGGSDPGVFVIDTGVRREDGYLYLLTEDGDLARVPM